MCGSSSTLLIPFVAPWGRHLGFWMDISVTDQLLRSLNFVILYRQCVSNMLCGLRVELWSTFVSSTQPPSSGTDFFFVFYWFFSSLRCIPEGQIIRCEEEGSHLKSSLCRSQRGFGFTPQLFGGSDKKRQEINMSLSNREKNMKWDSWEGTLSAILSHALINNHSLEMRHAITNFASFIYSQIGKQA